MNVVILHLALVAVASSQTCQSAGVVGPCRADGACLDPTSVCTSRGTAMEACCAKNEVVPDNLNPMATCFNVGIGPCTANKYCGPTATCTNIGKADEACCDNRLVILVPPPLPTVPPQQPCVDLLNPANGVSDCPRMASYCNNAVYYDLMTEQCPRTCNRCPRGQVAPPVPTTCVDKINPATGVSDCTKMANYCNNAVYYDLMTDQCPRTCRRC